MTSAKALKVPVTTATHSDLLVLQHESERLLEERVQARLAKHTANAHRPVSPPTAELAEVLRLNELELTEVNLRNVGHSLAEMRKHAPLIRLAFASEPNREVITKLSEWFRREVHPALFLQIGVQPMVAAGVVVHTPMRRYDFSLRNQLLGSSEKFIEVLNRV